MFARRSGGGRRGGGRCLDPSAVGHGLAGGERQRVARQRLALQRLGVNSIRDLLYYFPHRYDDFSHLKTTVELQYGQEVTLVATIHDAQLVPTRRGLKLIKVILADESGFVEATWFNQPYLLRSLTKGKRIVVSGRVGQFMGRLNFQSPEWEYWSEDLVHTGRLAPVYGVTEGLTVRTLRRIIKPIISDWAPRLSDCLPDTTRPVSYTHLRAHETVLDLVCRLLLEKKKNNTLQNNHRISHNIIQHDHTTYTKQATLPNHNS